METNFNSEFFVGNRKKLRQLFTGTAPIVITSNGLLQRGGDSPYPFAQDANFWYLTGLSQPDLLLVMDRSREYLIVPQREDNRLTFDGALDHTDISRRSGIQSVISEVDGWKALASRLKKTKHVATIAAPASYLQRYGMYTNPARASLIKKIRTTNPAIGLLDITMHLVRMRMVKQPPELAAIKTAINVTIDSLNQVLQPSVRRKYSFEYELEADLTAGFRRRGASGHAFEPIIAGGARACTLHNIANDGALSSDELVILDIGAEVNHYAADITRTIALGNPSRRQAAVYQAVSEVQAFAMSHLRPGVFLQAYETKVEKYLGQKLKQLGLISKIEHDQIRKYYPHATSHFLGLNVHDVGDYSLALESGNVLTVEPGIYIPEEGIAVRLEDDVLITKNGMEVLSGNLPRLLT